MNAIILCEGSTDAVLIQYYMRRVHAWEDGSGEDQKGALHNDGQASRVLRRDLDQLTIMPMGGKSKLGSSLHRVLERIYNAAPDMSDGYERIMIIMDRDDEEEKINIIKTIQDVLKEKTGETHTITEREWQNSSLKTNTGVQADFKIACLLVPPDSNGAMETFLLNSISRHDEYDGEIINKCNQFVDHVDTNKKYLNHRRLITKAKFDVYFSVRTPADQFVERQDIIKGVEWEKYTEIQKGFRLLADI